jgi:dihydroflavonol-4-reductase
MSEMTKQKIHITGGTGFIGKQLIRSLSKRSDCDIVMLTRDSSVIEPWLNEACAGRVRCCSLASVDSLVACIDNSDCDAIVIHLAAQMDFYPQPSHLQTMEQVNVCGTENLLRAARKCGVKRFVYCSSTEAMGPSRPDGTPSDEDDPCRPSYAYGRTKLAAEQAIQRLCAPKTENDDGEEEEKGGSMHCVTLRLSGVYGPDDRFTIFELIEMINAGWMFFVPGSGNARLMYTHVDDAVAAIELAAIDAHRGGGGDDDDTPRYEVYNVCPDEALSYGQWIGVLCRLLGRAQPHFSLPLPLCASVIRALAPLMNLARRRTFMWQPYTIYRMGEHRCYSNRRAREQLGFAPKYNIECGLESTVAHLIANGHIVKHRVSPLLVATVAVALILLFVFRLCTS